MSQQKIYTVVHTSSHGYDPFERNVPGVSFQSQIQSLFEQQERYVSFFKRLHLETRISADILFHFGNHFMFH